MNSSEDALKLLTRWKNSGAEIRISLSASLNIFNLVGVGKVTSASTEVIELEGAGFGFSIDTTEVIFKNVISSEYVRASGADPVKSGEQIEVDFGSGLKLLLVLSGTFEAN